MSYFYIILYLAVFMGEGGQVLLKIGSGRGGLDLGIICLSTWVMLGFGAMGMSMLLSVRGLSVVPLRDMAFILPAAYVLVPLFSRIFLKEKVNARVMTGTIILIMGIALFNIPLITLF
jgi:drug/metabolite transporter (DMT)-like permease